MSDDLKHHGVLGMKWGVRRERSSPGGPLKVVAEQTPKKEGKLTQQLNSMKRERQWKKVVQSMNTLTTKEIKSVSSRIQKENDLKRLSKSKSATPKDRQDYLRRDKMSDQELSRKIGRLNAKESLTKNASAASKAQREFGEKVVRVGSALGVKYALDKSISAKDIMNAVSNPKNASKQAKDSLVGKAGPEYKDALKGILDKIDKPDKDKK